MRLLGRLLAVASALSMTALTANAHEFWIDPEEYQVPAGQTVTANLRNGENFVGGSLAWFDHWRVRSEARLDEVTPLEGRSGDFPAISHEPMGEGLLRLVHQTNVDLLTYKEPAKFQRFLDHKDLDASALPDLAYPFREGYARYTKALVAVGHGAGQDDVAGLEIEFVAQKNPYVEDVSAGLPVVLIYQDAPRADAQVEVFEKAPDGEVTISLLRTDAQGVVLVPVQAGHTYLLDSVVLRLPDAALAAEKDIAWETLWAALTFQMPE